MRLLRITFLLFVVSTMVSQSLMDLFSTLLCFQWIYLVWKSKKTESSLSLLRPMGLEKWWTAWFVIVIVGFILNWNDSGYSFERIIEFKWILIFYVLCQVFYEIKPDRRAVPFIVALGFGISAVTLILYFTELDILQSWRYGVNDEFVRAGGFFANPMTFAHSFVILLSFILGIFILDRRNWNRQWRVAMGIVLLLSLASLYFTFTRGVWIGFGVGLAVGTFFWRPKYLIILALFLIFGFWISYSVSPLFRQRIDGTKAEVAGFSERKLLWKAHFQIFKENPIFGAGYGQNTKQLPRVYAEMGAPKNTLVSHAHNQYLHLAAGTGFLGLLCYLSIWSFFLKKTFDVWKYLASDPWDQGVALGLLIAQVAFVMGSFTEANFEHSKVRFMVMLAWAYVIYLTRKYSENLHPSQRKLKV